MNSHGLELPIEVPPIPDVLNTIDTQRDYLSGKLVGLATDLDRFFGDNRNFQESNKSVLQLDVTRLAGYHGEPKFVLSGKGKLDLPNTENRLHLLLESDPDKNISGNTLQAQTTPANTTTNPSSYAAALRYEKERENLWHFSTDAGVQFHGLSTNPFARARASYEFPLDLWHLKLAETAFVFKTVGVGESTQFDVEHIISEPILFRATSNATWLRNTQNFDLRQDFTLYHTLSERTALLYQASAIGVTHPQTHVTDYVLLTLYRYRLHRSWIFLELSPQLHFPKERGFQTSPALLMRLEFLFDGSR